MQTNNAVKYQGIDALRNRGESLPDWELAARAFYRWGISAGARFCRREGICLEDCLKAVQVYRSI